MRSISSDDGVPRFLRTPLSRAEALDLLGGTGIGLVVYTSTTASARAPGFHLVVGDELVILTIVTAELDATVRSGGLLTYQAGSVDDLGRTGWEASFSGPVQTVVEPVPLGEGRRIAFGSEPGPGSRVVRLPLRHVEGHRFQRWDPAA